MISGWERIKQVENITQTHLWKYTSHIQTAEYHRDCGVAWAHFTCTNSLATMQNVFSKKCFFFSPTEIVKIQILLNHLQTCLKIISHIVPQIKMKMYLLLCSSLVLTSFAICHCKTSWSIFSPLRRVMRSPQLQPLAYGSPQCVQSASSKTSIMGCPGRQEPLGVRGLANSRLHSDSE